MENAYTKTPAEALQHFQVTEEKGLSEQQVKDLRAKHGKNGMLAMTRQEQRQRANARNSAARRPPNAHLGAHPRAVQGPARHHPARLGSRVLRACLV